MSIGLDFEKDLIEKHEIEIFPKGWIPVTIEYGLKKLGLSSSWELCWRVKGTQHVFRIPLVLFYEDSQGDYEAHFQKVLEVFRSDYLQWQQQGFTQDWMQKYRKEFSKFIITFD